MKNNKAKESCLGRIKDAFRQDRDESRLLEEELRAMRLHLKETFKGDERLYKELIDAQLCGSKVLFIDDSKWKLSKSDRIVISPPWSDQKANWSRILKNPDSTSVEKWLTAVRAKLSDDTIKKLLNDGQFETYLDSATMRVTILDTKLIPRGAPAQGLDDVKLDDVELKAGTHLDTSSVNPKPLERAASDDPAALGAPPPGGAELRTEDLPAAASGVAARPPQPPTNAEFLLHLLLSSEEGEALLGDLAERYGKMHARFGERRAKTWFYAQVARSVWPLLSRIMAKAGGLTVLGEWIRRNIW